MAGTGTWILGSHWRNCSFLWDLQEKSQNACQTKKWWTTLTLIWWMSALWPTRWMNYCSSTEQTLTFANLALWEHLRYYTTSDRIPTWVDYVTEGVDYAWLICIQWGLGDIGYRWEIDLKKVLFSACSTVFKKLLLNTFWEDLSSYLC